MILVHLETGAVYVDARGSDWRAYAERFVGWIVYARLHADPQRALDAVARIETRAYDKAREVAAGTWESGDIGAEDLLEF
jgi:hypothetical protein